MKPAEPPPGVAALLAHLSGEGIAASVIDANLEAYLYLLEEPRLAEAAGARPGTSLRRAVSHARRALSLLRGPAGLASFPRYAAAVRDVNRALSVYRGSGGGERLTLGDYAHDSLSEFEPADLERLAAGEASTLFSGYLRERLVPRIARLDPRLIGISVNYRHQVLPAFELAGLLARQLPRTPVVAGGGMFSAWKSALRRSGLRFSAFSRIVLGPGEAPLSALARGEPGGDAYCLEDSSSPAFRPDYGFAEPGDYLSPVPVLPVSASRGCYWRRCLFCPEAASPTQPHATFPPDALPGLLRELSQRHGAVHFHFTDDAIPVGALSAMAARQKELAGLSWYGFVRFERALLDRGLVGDLAEAGCAMLQLGLESGSQEVLDRLGKGTRVEEAEAILANLKRAGIATYVYAMLGTPGETEADAELTLRFLEDHAAEIDYLNLALMNLPRESGLLADSERFGIRASSLHAESGTLGLYRTFEPATGWGRDAARRFLQRRLLGSPAIRGIVRRTPPYFTSNHAFLFRRNR
ncbi:MAG TPA: radical SAM protein [Candidatus Deferrimicrobiaceae bacterium]